MPVEVGPVGRGGGEGAQRKPLLLAYRRGREGVAGPPYGVPVARAGGHHMRTIPSPPSVKKRTNPLSRLFKATFPLYLSLGFDSKVPSTVLKELCCLIPLIFHKKRQT
jgi:hypothetical protein